MASSQNQIEHLFRIGKVVEKPAKNKKSGAWNSFVRIHYVPSNEYANFLKCKSCGSFLKHHKSNSGTIHLRTQLTARSKTTGNENAVTISKTKQTKITAFGKPAKPSKSVLENFQQACLKFVVCDLRPLQFVEGTGFIQLVQTAIDIGATHGSCSVESLVPSRKTVKRRMSTEKEKVTDNLKETLSSAINQYDI